MQVHDLLARRGTDVDPTVKPSGRRPVVIRLAACRSVCQMSLISSGVASKRSAKCRFGMTRVWLGETGKPSRLVSVHTDSATIRSGEGWQKGRSLAGMVWFGCIGVGERQGVDNLGSDVECPLISADDPVCLTLAHALDGPRVYPPSVLGLSMAQTGDRATNPASRAPLSVDPMPPWSLIP